MSEIHLSHAPELDRFEATVDGVRAGIAEYHLTNELIAFTHTKVDPAYEGRGVGSALVRYAMDAVRADGTRKVLPVCPFVKEWIQRHPEYLDIA